MFEPFSYSFFTNAFIAGIIIGVIAPLIGMFLVVRRYSLIADMLAHVSLVGVAAGSLLGINPAFTALATAIAAALGMEYLRAGKKILGESVLALFLSGGLAVAIVLLSTSKRGVASILSFLFGSIATVTATDVWTIGLLGLFVVATIALLYKELFLVALNEELAQSGGLKVKVYNMVLMILAAVVVALAIRIVGVLLIGALMVIPVLTATQFGFGFIKTLVSAIGASLLSVVVGLFGSYYLDLATGGTIVVVALLGFGLSVFLNRKNVKT